MKKKVQNSPTAHKDFVVGLWCPSAVKLKTLS
jgi:hypothetical protein